MLTLTAILKARYSNPHSFLCVFIRHWTRVLQSVVLRESRVENVHLTCNPSSLLPFLPLEFAAQEIKLATCFNSLLECSEAQWGIIEQTDEQTLTPRGLRTTEQKSLKIQSPEVKEPKCMLSPLCVNISVALVHYMFKYSK